MTPTREQIIQWAREAGGTNYRNRHVETTAIGFMPDALERFAQAVRADENDACAQEADAHASVEGIAQRIAAAIRARITNPAANAATKGMV